MTARLDAFLLGVSSRGLEFSGFKPRCRAQVGGFASGRGKDCLESEVRLSLFLASHRLFIRFLVCYCFMFSYIFHVVPRSYTFVPSCPGFSIIALVCGFINQKTNT